MLAEGRSSEGENSSTKDKDDQKPLSVAESGMCVYIYIHIKTS